MTIAIDRPCVSFKPPARGSYNICYFVKFRLPGDDSAVPTRTGLPADRHESCTGKCGCNYSGRNSNTTMAMRPSTIPAGLLIGARFHFLINSFKSSSSLSILLNCSCRRWTAIPWASIASLCVRLETFFLRPLFAAFDDDDMASCVSEVIEFKIARIPSRSVSSFCVSSSLSFCSLSSCSIRASVILFDDMAGWRLLLRLVL